LYLMALGGPISARAGVRGDLIRPRPTAFHGPHPSPGQLRRPPRVLARTRPRWRHRPEWLRERVRVAFAVSMRWILILRPARPGRGRRPAEALVAFEAEEELPVPPLLQLVGAAVPDLDRAAPYSCPSVIVPSNVMYSSGWGPRCGRLCVGGRGVFGAPVGPAHEGRRPVLEPQVPSASGCAVFLTTKRLFASAFSLRPRPFAVPLGRAGRRVCRVPVCVRTRRVFAIGSDVPGRAPVRFAR